MAGSRSSGIDTGRPPSSSSSSLPMGGATDDAAGQAGKDRRTKGTKPRTGRKPRSGSRSKYQKAGSGKGVVAPGMDPAEWIKNPRVLLVLACLWPLAVLALFAASSGGGRKDPPALSSRAILSEKSPGMVAIGGETEKSRGDRGLGARAPRFDWRAALDRVDVVGYGPTHPRVAFVVVGDTVSSIAESVESVFAKTDPRRIFVVCAVLDGSSHRMDSSSGTATDRKKDHAALVRKLRKIEKGGGKRGTRKKDTHADGDDDGDDDDDEENDLHPRKTHVLFNHEKERKGLAASRSDAAEFVQVLAQTHESAGFKNPNEDLILVLVQAGTRFHHHTWLEKVTPALVVAPPLLGLRDQSLSTKLANAISFRVEGIGKRTSLDARLLPSVEDAPAADMNLSNGNSVPTPVLNGAAVAMRLDTFVQLPKPEVLPPLLSDPAADPWVANLELSLGLWLCADGIDILEDVEVAPPPGGILFPQSPLATGPVARIASAWMAEEVLDRFFGAYSAAVEDDDQYRVTRPDWDKEVTLSRRWNGESPGDLYKKCRTMDWYFEKVVGDADLVPKPDEGAVGDDGGGDDGGEEEEEDQGEEEGQEEEGEDQEDEDAGTDAPVENEAGKHRETEEEVVDPNRRKPTVPLRPANLEIVRLPRQVDLAYVDVSNGHREHPHMPALDADGVPGYVHDETALRRNPPALDYPGLTAGCAERDDNYAMMHGRIVVEPEANNKEDERRDKIFCLVYTIESGHPKIPGIRQTWGPKCDGFMVGSTKTDPSIGAVNIPHEGPEEYDNIWQKVRSMWSYIYDNYYEKYDWFHIGGDDLFLIVENLRYYLESEEIRTAANGGIYLPEGNETKQTPLLLGRRFAYQGDMNDIFDSGGSGYTMNKAALKLLVTEGFPNYFPHRKTFSEDTMVATLFKKIDNVLPYDTKDEEGGERYMPFLPGHHYSYRIPDDPTKDWYAMYSIDIKEGLEHCARRSLAFHYVKGDMMKRLFALAYGLCPSR